MSTAAAYHIQVVVEAQKARRELQSLAAEMQRTATMARGLGNLPMAKNTSREQARANANAANSYDVLDRSVKRTNVSLSRYTDNAVSANAANNLLARSSKRVATSLVAEATAASQVATTRAAGAVKAASEAANKASQSGMTSSGSIDTLGAMGTTAAATTVSLKNLQKQAYTTSGALTRISTTSRAAATGMRQLQAASAATWKAASPKNITAMNAAMDLLKRRSQETVPSISALSGQIARLTKNAEAATVAMRNLGVATTQMGTAMGAANAQMGRTGTRLSNAVGAMNKANTDAAAASGKATSAFSQQMHQVQRLGASMNWAGRQVAMSFTLPFGMVTGAAIKWQMEVEQIATRMVKVYDDIDDGIIQRMSESGPTFQGSKLDRYFDALSVRMGQSKAEVMEIGTIWAQTGLTGANLAQATRLTSEAMILGDMDANTAAQSLISLQAQYNLAFGDFTKERERARKAAAGDAAAIEEQRNATDTLTSTLATLNMVENTTATSFTDLVEAFSRSAVFAREAGVGVGELAGHIAALTPATGSAERAGNALKTIYASLSTDKSAKQLQQLEYAATNAGLAVDAFTSKEFRDRGMGRGIEDIARAYSKLSGADKLQWGKDVFGIYQMVRGMQLLEDVARGVGIETTESGESLSVLASQYARLSNDTEKAAFVQERFGVTGAENKAIMDQLSEAAANAGDNVSYYGKAMAGQTDAQVYEQYARELTTFLESNPQQMKQAWTMIQNSIMKAVIPLIPVLIGFLNTIAKLTKWFSELPPGVQKFAMYAGLAVAVVGPLAMTLGSLLLMVSLLGRSFSFLSLGLGLFTKRAAGAGAGAAAARKSFFGLGKTASKAGDDVAKAGGKGGKGFVASLLLPLRGIGGLLMRVLGPLGGIVLNALKGLGGTLVRALAPIGGTLLRMFAGIGSRLLPVISGIFTWPVTLALLAVEGLLRAGGSSITKLVGELFSGVGDIISKVMGDGGIPLLAKPFVVAAEVIYKVMANLPKVVMSAFRAIGKGIANIAKGIYKAFSYINPFARHSPSLVENVTKGTAIIQDRFSAMGDHISGVMRGAYTDINAFGRKTAGVMQRSEEMQINDQRAKVAQQAPQALPEFDRLVATKGVLTRELDVVNNAIKAQEARVKAADAAVKRYDDTLAKMNRSLELAERGLDKVNDSLENAQKRYDRFASAQIAGLGAVEDSIFANEMAQKRLRLAMLDAGGEANLEDTADQLSKIAGQIEDISGRRNDLRMKGAGSDILAPFDAEIAKLRGQQNSISVSAKDDGSISSMEKQLEKLQKQAERMDLEKALKFDPLTRQVERFTAKTEEIPFAQIMSGLRSSQSQVDLYQGRLDSLNASLDNQRAAITAVEDQRYTATLAAEREQEVLTGLSETQTELQNVISAIDEAINSVTGAIDEYTQAMERATQASTELADAQSALGGVSDSDLAGAADAAGGVGGAGDMGAGAMDDMAGISDEELGGADLSGIPDDLNMDDMLAEMENEIADKFGSIDLGQMVKDWITGAFDGVGNWFKDIGNKIWEGLQTLVTDILPRLPGLFIQIMYKAYEGLVEGVWFLLGYLPGLALRIIIGLGKAIIEGLQAIGDLKQKIGDFLQRAFEGAKEWVKNVDWSALPGQIWSALTTWDNWVGAWDKLYEIGGNILGGLWEGIKSVFSNVWEWVDEHMITPLVDGFKKGLGIESPSTVFMEFGVNIVQGLWNGIASFAQLIWEFIWNFVNDNIIQPVVGFVADMWNKGWEFVSNLWSGISSWAGGLWENVWNFVNDNVIQPVVGFVTDMWNKGWEFVSNLWNGISSWAGGLWENVKNFVWDNIVSPVANFIGDMWDKGWEFVSNLWNGIASWAGGLWTNVKNFVNDNIIQPVKDKAGDLLQTGKDLISGFWEGIKSMGSWLKDKITTWVKEHIPDPIREALNIHSPSRVTAEIGEQVAEGLVVGMESKTEDVAAAAATLAAAATPQVAASISAPTIEAPTATDIPTAPALPDVPALPEMPQMPALELPAMPDFSGLEMPDLEQMDISESEMSVDGSLQSIEASQTAFNTNWSTGVTAMSTDTTNQMAMMATNVVMIGNAMFTVLLTNLQVFAATWAATISALVTNMITQFSLMYTTLTTIMANLYTYITTVIANLSSYASAAFATMANNMVSSATWMTTSVTQSMSWMAATLTSIINGQIYPVMNSFGPLLAAVVGWFATGTTNMITEWSRLREGAAAPVRFVIGTVFNDGLVGMWNSVSEMLGTTKMNTYPIAFATGGRVEGPGGGTDDRIPAMLSNGEYVMTADATRRLGVSNLDALNYRFNGYATDGSLTTKDDVRTMLADSGARKYAGGGIVEGDATWKRFKRAHDFARKWNGSPYVWGGSLGPDGGTDCSGYMSSIADVIHGGSGLMRQWATGAFPGGGGAQGASGPQGFVRGLGGGMAIGVSTVHTAGTLGGVPGLPTVNVESGGGHGRVAYGGPATGADDGQFPSQYHLAIEGLGRFVSGGGGGASIFSMVDALVGEKWGPVQAAVDAANFPGLVGQELPKAVSGKLKEAFDKKIEKLMEEFGGDPGGTGAERWRPLAMRAMAMVGFDPTNKAQVDAMIAQIQSESGGNPGILQQVQDVNSGGNEGMGLLQIIPGTFAAHRDPSLPNDRTHPLANMVASLRYYKSRYGMDLTTMWGHGHGYDEGGILPPTPGGFGTYYNHTGKPEAVLTNEQWNAIYRNVNSGGQVDYRVSNSDLAEKIIAKVSGEFTGPTMAIWGETEATAEQLAALNAKAEDQKGFWDTFKEQSDQAIEFLGELKEVADLTVTAINETKAILVDEDGTLADGFQELATIFSDTFSLHFDEGSDVHRILTDISEGTRPIGEIYADIKAGRLWEDFSAVVFKGYDNLANVFNAIMSQEKSAAEILGMIQSGKVWRDFSSWYFGDSEIGHTFNSVIEGTADWNKVGADLFSGKIGRQFYDSLYNSRSFGVGSQPLRNQRFGAQAATEAAAAATGAAGAAQATADAATKTAATVESAAEQQKSDAELTHERLAQFIDVLGKTLMTSASKFLGAWQPLTQKLADFAAANAELPRFFQSSKLYYDRASGFFDYAKMGFGWMFNTMSATLELLWTTLPAMLNHMVSIAKTSLDFAIENGDALASVVTAVVTGNPLAVLPYLPQLLSFGLELLPMIIKAVQEIVPNLIKGILNVIDEFLFGGTRGFTYDTYEDASSAARNNTAAIRNKTFIHGSESGTVTPTTQNNSVTINGDIVMPNVRNEFDGDKFLNNLSSLK